MEIVRVYLITFIVFFSLDLFWLGFVARRFYKKYLGSLLLDKVKWTPGLLFYVFNIIGIIYFAIWPALKTETLITALMNGALFGFFTYSTYDLTNYATLKNWAILVVIVDIFWGTLLTALVSLSTYLLLTNVL